MNIADKPIVKTVIISSGKKPNKEPINPVILVKLSNNPLRLSISIFTRSRIPPNTVVKRLPIKFVIVDTNLLKIPSSLSVSSVELSPLELSEEPLPSGVGVGAGVSVSTKLSSSRA